MIVACSGSHSTGKSSAVHELAKTLGDSAIVLPDPFREIPNALPGCLNPRQIMYAQGDERAVESVSSLTGIAFGMERESITHALREGKDLIIDQGPLGVFAYYRYWIEKLNGDEPLTLLDGYKDRLSELVDVHFLFPIGVLPIEDDGVRPTDPNFQEAIHAHILQLYEEADLPADAVHRIESETLEGRIQEMNSVLRHRQG